MFTELEIHQYRGLAEFTMSGLGRVNLLVGENGCGKTSVLEAIQVLKSRGDPTVLSQIANRRGELHETDNNQRPPSLELDVSHMFHGHRLVPDHGIGIDAKVDDHAESAIIRIVKAPRKPFQVIQTLSMEIKWTDRTAVRYQLTDQMGIRTQEIRTVPSFGPPLNVLYISTAGLTVNQVVQMFEHVVLSDEEQIVTDALKSINPEVERIATVSANSKGGVPGERGGVVVKCSGATHRVPIGSLGDGTWRMLGLALALTYVKGGTLLVDEIDTGLHFSVMERMWQLVNETAKRLSVQVFATTHSRDCYESLAAIAREDVAAGSEVTIQRIDIGSQKSVAFTEQEIVAAAERGIEVR